jgi:two-component system, NarL family, sensor histidine kinase DevS
MSSRSAALDALGTEFSWSLLEAAPDGMLIVDRHGEVVFVNDHAAGLLGFAGEDLLGRKVEDLMPDGARTAHRSHRARYQAAPTVRTMGAGMVLRAKRADGTDFPVEISLSPLSMNDETYTVAALRDVTDRIEAEQELRRSQDALRDAEQVLALADDRERIARDLHDTVIQRLFGAGLQLQATSTGADERTRERLQATITDLDETIKELRAAIFALQGPGPNPHGVRGRLVEVIADAGAGLGFEPRLQFDGPIETMDAPVVTHVEAVLREAVTNVARHADADHVRISISLDHDEVVLVVVDDGRGVPDGVVGGRGLVNLAGRAHDLGGSFTIGPDPDGGSRLEWRAPALSRT